MGRMLHVPKQSSSEQIKTMLKVGDILRKRRLQLNKSFMEVSQETKIAVDRLKDIESNKFLTFESSIYIRGFIKIYASYLELDVPKILAIYRRDISTITQKKEPSKKEDSEKPRINSFSWKSIYLVGLVVLAIGVLFYLYIQFYNFRNPPRLTLITPTESTTVQEEKITLKGITEEESKIEINGQVIALKDDDTFEKEIVLKPGENILTIKAYNSRNPSNDTTKIITITYEVPVEEEKEEIVLIDSLNTEIEIKNSATWIEVIIDDQLIISQILPIGYKKSFEAKRNVKIVTGILANTFVTINGEKKELSELNSISCMLENNTISCN